MDRSEKGAVGLRYQDAGVDLDAAERTKDRLKALVASTRDANTLSEMGTFGGLYQVPAEFDQPVLVSSADGVGTKLKVAFMAERHDTVGEDLVNHCVNDILVQGAVPLFFLDYLASGEMDEVVVAEVVTGIARGCKANGCALLGGETAQMAGFYTEGEYDLAGFIVGAVSKSAILDGQRVQEGDTLLAMASDGLHTNGYTLARAIVFERMGLSIDDPMPGTEQTVGEALLQVHRSYLPSIRPLLGDSRLKALAHITGGGVPGNLPRVLPDGLGAEIDRGSWEVPGLFQALAAGGGVELTEMDRVFNMGVGMIAVVAPGDAESVAAELAERGETVWALGRVTGESGVRYRV